MHRSLLAVPWVVFGVAAIASIVGVHSGAPASATVETSAHPPVLPIPRGGVRPGPSSPSGETLAPLSEDEKHEIRTRIPHEACEEGVKRVNELSGRAPTDPTSVPLVGSCLKYGNIAWYKCLLRASNGQEATSCNKRLLISP